MTAALKSQPTTTMPPPHPTLPPSSPSPSPWRTNLEKRFHRHTWQWYNLPTAVLGYSLLLYSQPFQFHGLWTLALVVYLLGAAAYFVILLSTLLVVVAHRGSLATLLTAPRRALHRAGVAIAAANLIGGAHQFALPVEGTSLSTAILVFFWIYAACAFIELTVLLLIIGFASVDEVPPSGDDDRGGSTTHFGSAAMTPSWVLPILPPTLCGTLAGLVAGTLEDAHRVPVLLAGLVFNGAGVLLSLAVFAIWFNRLFSAGLPGAEARPEMFYAVGPPAFTAQALILMASDVPEDVDYFARVPLSATILRVVALFAGVFCWGLSLVFCVLGAVAVAAAARRLTFHFAWYGMVFPNVGFVLAIIRIGTEFESPAVLWVGAALTIVLGALLLVVIFFHCLAVLRGQEF